jgi:hypothetical protein
VVFFKGGLEMKPMNNDEVLKKLNEPAGFFVIVRKRDGKYFAGTKETKVNCSTEFTRRLFSDELCDAFAFPSYASARSARSFYTRKEGFAIVGYALELIFSDIDGTNTQVTK